MKIHWCMMYVFERDWCFSLKKKKLMRKNFFFSTLVVEAIARIKWFGSDTNESISWFYIKPSFYCFHSYSSIMVEFIMNGHLRRTDIQRNLVFFFRFFYFFQLFLMVVNPNFNFITRNKMSDSVKLKKTWARPWPQNKTKHEEFFSWTNISKCSSSLTTAVKLSTPFIYIILSTKYPKVFFEWQK